MKCSGVVCTFVKLQRPPPEIRIFLATASLRSRTKTDRPRFPASMPHIRPAAPAPIITTSYSTRGSYTLVIRGQTSKSPKFASSIPERIEDFTGANLGDLDV